MFSLCVLNRVDCNFNAFHHLQESIHRRSDANSLQRSQKLPIILRIKTSGEVYNYGSQALNSAEMAREQLRQILSKVSRMIHVLWLYRFTQLVQLFNDCMLSFLIPRLFIRTRKSHLFKVYTCLTLLSTR